MIDSCEKCGCSLLGINDTETHCQECDLKMHYYSMGNDNPEFRVTEINVIGTLYTVESRNGYSSPISSDFFDEFFEKQGLIKDDE